MDNKIVLQQYDPDNFTRLPNMAFEELDPHAYKLLGVYLYTARGEGGVCFRSNANVAKFVGCSVNRMKKARAVLVRKAYIAVTKGDEETGETAKVIVLNADMWKRNATWNESNWLSQNDTPLSQNDRVAYQTVTPPLSQNDTEVDKVKKIKESTFAPSSDDAPTPSNKPVISQAPVVSQVSHSVPQDAATLSSADYERMMQLIVTIPSITQSLQHKLYHVLRGTTKKGGWGYEQSQFMVATPMTPDELCEFQKWMRKHQNDIYASMKSPVTILSWVEQYRQARDAYLASQLVTAQAEAISSEFYV